MEAIDGLQQNYQAFTDTNNEKGRPGDIGCKESHRKVAMMAKDRGLRNYLVFEDDVDLAPNFELQFDKFIGQLPEDWDMLYFGGNHDKPITQVSTNIARMSHTYTTHAIAVNAKAFDQVIDVLGATDKVDLCISSLHSRLNCYVTRPHIAFQRAGYSDILQKDQTYKHLHNYRFIPLGLRCSAKGLLEEYFVEEPTFPFDWVDTNLQEIERLIACPRADIGVCVKKWLSSVDEATLKNLDGTWFPHDFVDPATADFALQVAHGVDKYTRRFKRLYELYDSGDNLIFLTVAQKYIQSDRDLTSYNNIKEYICNQTKGQCIFIGVNMLSYIYAEADKQNNISINLKVDFIVEWPDFERDIANQLMTYSHTQNYFPAKLK